MSVELRDLGHHFPASPWLFRHINKSLSAGRSYALIGPSGSGKSTLLSLIAGWMLPAEGAVTVSEGSRVAWVFQNPHGSPRRLAVDHVAFPLLSSGYSRSEAHTRACALLDTFGLSAVADREFRALSGGEAQRLMLARAVASRPTLLLVDEPTAQLDLVTRREVNAAISRLVNHDTVVVVATHDEHTRDACTDILDLEDFAVDQTSTELPSGNHSAQSAFKRRLWRRA